MKNNLNRNWATLGVALLAVTLSACGGGGGGTSTPSSTNNNLGNGAYNFSCGSGEERMNNECVPANLAFEQKCAMAGGILIPINGGLICQNIYVETLRASGFFQPLPPTLSRVNAANPAARVLRGGDGRQYVVRAGDKLKYWGAGTYGKDNCNGRNYAGKNTNGGAQNYYPYNGTSTNGAAGDEEGFMMSDGTTTRVLGNNNQQSPTIIAVPGNGGLFVGLNQAYGNCAHTNNAVKIQLEQCTNSSMQPVTCQ